MNNQNFENPSNNISPSNAADNNMNNNHSNEMNDIENVINISNALNRIVKEKPEAVFLMVSHCKIFPFIISSNDKKARVN